MSDLTSKKRDALKDSDFALPNRRYPIHDEAHARNALARVAQHGTAEEKAKVKAAVKKRYPDIKVGEGDYVAEQMVAADGGAFALYSPAGDKKLGTFKTAEAARAHWGRLADAEEALATGRRTVGLAEGFAVAAATGALLVESGARCELREEDMARLSDAQLKKARSAMVDKRAGLRKSQADMKPEDRYSTPDGSALNDDLWYYNSVISRLEAEMACRLLTLD